MFQKFLNWLVTSSYSPQEISLTIQGILIQWVGFIIAALQYFHVSIAAGVLQNWIMIACSVFGSFLGIFGLVRKIILTIKNRKVAV